jgi:hypothetical protein
MDYNQILPSKLSYHCSISGRFQNSVAKSDLFISELCMATNHHVTCAELYILLLLAQELMLQCCFHFRENVVNSYCFLNIYFCHLTTKHAFASIILFVCAVHKHDRCIINYLFLAQGVMPVLPPLQGKHK